MNILTQPINRLLHFNQLEEVIRTLFINYPVKILKVIAKTGKYKQSTAWVYLENEITGDRRATFLSFDDLLRAFWCWLETAEVTFKAFWERISISKVVWQFVNIGDTIYNCGYGWGKVVHKDWTEKKGIPRFWVEFGDRLEKIMPCEAEIF